MPQMECKYDPRHGTFVNATTLRAHYDAEHPEYAAGPKRAYRCKICGRVVTGPQAHITNVHPEAERPPHGTTIAAHYFDRATDDDVYYRGRRRREHTPAGGGLERLHVASHRGRFDVDDFVLPVVEALASPSGMFPVAHLAAVLAWRDATAVMLEALQR